MRLAGVTTIEQANEFLNSYIPKFNAQFALPLKTSKSVFETQPPEDKINLYLSILTQRTVDAGHCIKFKKKYYRFLNSEGMYMDFHKGTKVMVIETFDAQLFVTVADRVFALEEVALHEARSRYFGNNVKDKAESRKVYIPDMNHPWRKDNFMKHVYAMLGKERRGRLVRLPPRRNAGRASFPSVPAEDKLFAPAGRALCPGSPKGACVKEEEFPCTS